jgi:hypothetical protein
VAKLSGDDETGGFGRGVTIIIIGAAIRSAVIAAIAAAEALKGDA